MKFILALACLALATALPLSTDPLSEDQYQSLYELWAKQHNKVADPERLPAFKANVDFVNKHNQEYQLGLHHYKTALNKFSDLTNKEFRAFYTGYKFVPRNNTENTVLLTGTAPDSVDWRTKGAVTPVKNQQQCGSCWSFSAIGAVEGANAIKYGKLVSFSEQELVDCDKTDSGCGGGLMDNAFDWIQKNGGIDTEEDYPYNARDSKCNEEKKAKHVGFVTGHVDVASNDEEQLKLAVANNGPVSVAIEADQSAFQMYSGGVFTGTCGTQLDHGVLVVGYGTESGKDYWIVKNSWGPSWGLNGYILLERGKGGAGQCGIAMQPSYPLA